ncbi:MAG TPA: ABC transporter substrate-binding protein [Chloroflexota bacterium]|nr:ABC transporter substrate-binding protein [Chloroflexota bacterium]
MLRVETLTRARPIRINWMLAAGLGLLPVAGILALGAGLSIKQVPATGGTLRLAFGGGSTFINPLLASSDTDVAISATLFPGLVDRTAVGGLTPGLAFSWNISAAGRTYTFRLNPGLSWQNGKPVTAYDVAYTYRLLASTSFPTHSDEWSGVRVTTPGRLTVVVHLPRPNYTFAQDATVGIIPNRYSGSRWPVGAGLFRLARVSRSRALLANTAVPGATTAYTSRLSFMFRATPGSTPDLSCNSSFAPLPPATAIPTTRLLGLVFNYGALPHRNVRKALISVLSHAKVPALAALSSPTPIWPAAFGPAVSPPVGSARRPATGSRPADLVHSASQRTLMRRAGWRLRSGRWHARRHTITLNLVASLDPHETPFVNAIAAAWRRNGFGVSVQRLSFSALVRGALYPGRFSAAVVDWDFGSPDYVPGELWRRNASLNFGHEADAAVTTLANQVPVSPSAATRNALRERIGNRLVSDGAAVGLAPEVYVCHASKRLHGYTPPTLVTDAGGLVLGHQGWYTGTRLVVKNPF